MPNRIYLWISINFIVIVWPLIYIFLQLIDLFVKGHILCIVVFPTQWALHILLKPQIYAIFMEKVFCCVFLASQGFQNLTWFEVTQANSTLLTGVFNVIVVLVGFVEGERYEFGIDKVMDILLFLMLLNILDFHMLKF